MQTDPLGDGRDREPITQLAILVVYYLVDDADLPLLRLHLDRIAQHTSAPYTLYAATNRVTTQARVEIAAQPNVVLCVIPPTELQGAHEHAYFLDAMVKVALADGASHLVTLDLDSFPIRDDWVEVLQAAAPPESGLTAILRVENGDSVLPHPSCTFARREFFERYEPSFSPKWDGTKKFRRFLRSHRQRPDTGVRLGYILWRHRLPWGTMVRTNELEVHYLMAGIYGEVVFHLGASSRRYILFWRDIQRSPIHRLTTPLARVGIKTSGSLRARAAAERRFNLRNLAILSLVREWLLADPEGFLTYLQGDELSSGTESWLERLDLVNSGQAAR